MIHMIVLLLKNYLKLFKNEMDIVYILIIEYKKNDSFCASYCLYIPYLTEILGIDFKSAVLNINYQSFS